MTRKNKYEGMKYIDYGLGAFARTVFEEIPEGQVCDLAEVYQRLLRTNQLAAFEFANASMMIGSQPASQI